MGCIAEDRQACPHPRGVSGSADSMSRPDDGRNPHYGRRGAPRPEPPISMTMTARSSCTATRALRRCASRPCPATTGCVSPPIWAVTLVRIPHRKTFTVTHADEYDTLPMSYEGDVATASSSGGILTLPVVEVQRVVTKVSYDIAVEPADIELRSVQLCSVPRAVSVFDVAARPCGRPRRLHGLPGKRDFGTAYFGELLSASEYAGHGSVHYRPAR